MQISVFGLGYVGAVSGACLADMGHDVVGVDVIPQKVDLLNQGAATIVEENIGELTAKAVKSGRFRATLDCREAVRASDISLICVGTPSNADGAPSTEALERVMATVAEAIREKNGAHSVVVRSTVLPGTTDECIAPILTRHSGREIGNGLGLCFNPEFLREGSSIKDFYNPPFIIVGSKEESTHQIMGELYKDLDSPFIKTTPKIAESVKYLCNTYHALKITFANEMGAMLGASGIDAREAFAIFVRDFQLNISPAYLRPGFAFGGSCLPKDLRAVLAMASRNHLTLPLLSNILEANRQHIERSFRQIASHGRRSIALFGLAFKAGTDDLRESPLVALAERLIGKGYKLAIYDPDVDAARLIGSNRDFIDREIPHLEQLLVSHPAAALEHGETVVIGHIRTSDVEAFRKAYRHQPVIDLQGNEDIAEIAAPQYEGICW